ncbi:MAG: hypothetical protein ABF289_03565 [Clostridiales bacterium]
MNMFEDNFKNKVFNDLHSIYEMLDVDLLSEIERVEKEIDKVSCDK